VLFLHSVIYKPVLFGLYRTKEMSIRPKIETMKIVVRKGDIIV